MVPIAVLHNLFFVCCSRRLFFARKTLSARYPGSKARSRRTRTFFSRRLPSSPSPRLLLLLSAELKASISSVVMLAHEPSSKFHFTRLRLKPAKGFCTTRSFSVGILIVWTVAPPFKARRRLLLLLLLLLLLELAAAGSKPVIIVEMRDSVVHPHRPSANLVKVEGEKQFTPDNGGRGPQIRKERKACPTCAEELPQPK